MQRVPRRQYTDDFKEQAVALAESNGLAKTARQFDMSVKRLANWIGIARAGKPLSASARQLVGEIEAKRSGRVPRTPRSTWSARSLKDATAFFAKESK